jgi:hypothetical protein
MGGFGASILENGASILENGASILENGASILENGASILENGASILENGASILENGASILENGTSILENGASGRRGQAGGRRWAARAGRSRRRRARNRAGRAMHPDLVGRQGTVLVRYDYGAEGRIADILKTHHFLGGEDLEQTLLRYTTLYNAHLPQAALDSQTPMNAMKMWHASHPQLFKIDPGSNRPGCDTQKTSDMKDWLPHKREGQLNLSQRWLLFRGVTSSNWDGDLSAYQVGRFVAVILGVIMLAGRLYHFSRK